MLARFDWQFHHKGELKPAPQIFGFVGLVTAILGMLLLIWLAYHHLEQPGWLSTLPEVVQETISLIETASIITICLLLALIWWRHQQRNKQLSVVTVDDLYALSPAAFEKYVADLFQKKGYQVKVRGRSGDAGVDLEIYEQRGRRAIVQCKRYRTMIGPDIVRELFGTMMHEGVHRAFLVTTADISQAARDWASSKPMTLIDGKSLVKIASSLNQK